ncbi:SAM-dependent methyltransferase [Nocardia sp. 2YAB30]|uniref:SAM-dependent methyltransferase n=1 Tax=unclassified Nocardia TaxID=2637762 RepID=UPI003F9828F6
MSATFHRVEGCARDVDTAVVDRAAEIYADKGIEFRPRSRKGVAALLSGCDLIKPGLVAAHRWRPTDDLDQRRPQRLGWKPP